MKKKSKNIWLYALIFIVALGVINYIFSIQFSQPTIKEITGNQFTKYLEKNQIKEVKVITNPEEQGEVKEYNLTLQNGDKVSLYREPGLYVEDVKKFESKNIVYQENVVIPSEPSFFSKFLIPMLIFGFIIMLLFGLVSKSASQQGNLKGMFTKNYEVLDFTNPNSKDFKLYNMTLDQVIGLPKNTKKQIEDVTYTLTKMVKKRLVGDVKMTGLLLYGPPGTGKSMLAKAIASSVRSYFIHVSGSDIVGKFVSQGAENINALFDTATKVSLQNNKAPVIVFIDEIDSFGEQRETGSNAASEESKKAINALLHRMSGLETEANIFVIAATNFKDSLDKALVRSGRLSTHIEVPAPDRDGRKQLFDYYLKKIPREIKLDSNVDTTILSEYAVNMTGADVAEIIQMMQRLANGVNSKVFFNLDDMIELIEERHYGTIREELMKDQDSLTHTAYHEAGHALLALRHFPTNVLKACITPRQKALGYVFHNIMDNRVSLFKKESKKYIEVTLGGYLAEELTFRDTSSGVRNDLEQANGLAKNLVQKFGAGNSLLIKPDETYKEGLSDLTMSKQETEMEKVLEECRKEAKNFLTKNKEILVKFANLLLNKKMLNKNDIQEFYNEHKLYFVEDENVNI